MSQIPDITHPGITHPCIEARNVSVSLGGTTILREVSLTLKSGNFVVLIGPNGAGKTTLLRALAGLIPTEGDLLIQQEFLANLTRRQRAQRIAYLPQGHQVHWPLAARDVVALGRFPHGLGDPARMTPDHAAIVDAAMARTGTTAFADRIVQSLSGGERARVMMARVLAVEAPILLADEPTASLDPHHQLAVMHDLKKEAMRGTLVIAVTHDIGLAARLADEVILLDEGRIVQHGTPRDVFTAEHLAKTYGISVIDRDVEGERLIVPWKTVP